nr:MAG TPA: hypothetical protein [Caudoviricetes sp.]
MPRDAPLPLAHPHLPTIGICGLELLIGPLVKIN